MSASRIKLIERRKEIGLTQQELSKKVEISRAYLTNIEKGKATPSLSVARKISTILECSLEDLFL